MPHLLARFACPLLFVVLFSAGCASHHRASDRSTVQRPRDLRWLEKADPERDALKAIARRDYRFLGVYGFAPFTPAVAPEIASRYGVKYIEGTSDAIRGRRDVHYHHLAKMYAAQYNTVLLQRSGRHNVVLTVAQE